MNKSPRTFRIDQELSSALDRIHKRQGDHTWHVEQALRAYPPIKKVLKGDSKEVSTQVSKGFEPPALADVGYYMASQGMGALEAQGESSKFVDFYESKGWLVGRNKMKSWQAAARNWVKRSSERKDSAGDTHKQSSFDRLTDRSWADGIVKDI